MKDLPPLSPNLSPEAAAEFAEIRRMMKSAAEERIAEEAKRKAEEAERQAKHDREIAEIRAIQKENGKMIGGLGNAEGMEMENDVADALEAAGEIGGIRLDFIYPDMKIHNRNPLAACQFDVVAVNGKYAVIVEVKRQLTLKDVRDFACESLPRFAEVFPQIARGKKVIGAMVYRRTHKGGSAVAAALKEGFLVLGVNNNNTLYQIKSAKDIINQAKKRAVNK